MSCSLRVPRLTVSAAFILALFACGETNGGSGGELPTRPEVDTNQNSGGADRLGGDTHFNPNQPDPADSGTSKCEPSFTGVVRDFQDSHPDFEHYKGAGETGIVQALLGPDSKPVYDDSRPHGLVSSKASFDEWYRDVPGKNISIPFVVPMVKQPNGSYRFDDQSFFPIDGRGFGNQGRGHNFHFTFELHTEFAYGGGEEFTFTGDDDLWVFINGKLAIDLGGVHEQQSKTIQLDALATQLGIAKGSTYPLDIFQAERHTDASHFRIETSLTFTNCAPIIR
jgi:fibro-slime domain-containing protein